MTPAAAGSAASGSARGRSLLIAARFVRSIGQGLMAVAFTLQLRALGWPAASIGTLLAAALAGGVVLTALSGPLSDRVGRRALMVAFEVAQALSAAAAAWQPSVAVLAVAAFVGQYGRGANGVAGPFGPVEQAWLAALGGQEDGGKTFSVNAAMGFLGMGVGALLAMLPAGWELAAQGQFLVVAVGALVNAVILLAVPDPQAAPPPAAPARVVQQENRNLAKLALANALQGAGIGLAGPLLAYWFAVRFGVTPEQIGPVMAASFAATAATTFVTGTIAARFGLVRTVVASRILGLLMLLALPFSPNFAVAGALYLARSLFNRGTVGARSAFTMGLVRAERHGFAASVNAISVQVPRALGPILAGVLFDSGAFALPFVLAAALQAGYVAVFGLGFRDQPGARAR
ncbi:MAG: MFS transporter [Rhodospirillales bacterium]|nr:MFS transporter [Rhodospirillales bacterium]